MIAMWMIEQERARQFGGKYAWVITRDRGHELDTDAQTEPSQVGTAGPSSATDELLELARTSGRRFRLMDEGDIDDCAERGGVSAEHPDYGLVYEGVIWTSEADAGSEIDFQPLHDFGAPHYGCVAIQYESPDGWADL